MLAPHGSVKRFAQDCRCDPCCEAARPYQEAWDATHTRGRLVHGTPSGRDRWHCECEPCREALAAQRHAAYLRRRDRRKSA